MKKILELFEDKKIRITFIFILIALFTIIMVVSIQKNKIKTPADSETPTNIVINEEIKTKLNKFVNYLSTGTYCELQAAKEFANDCIYRNNKTTRANLSETYRLYSLIMAIGESKENNMMVGNIVVEGVQIYNPYYVNLAEVEKEYKLLYGEKETFEPTIINNINKHVIKYDSSREKYLYQKSELESFVKTYIESYESTTNEVSVNVRVGYITYEFYKYHLYNDSSKTREISTKTTREYKESSIIDDTNYTELPKYKITFMQEEDSENIVFKSIELVQ